MSTSVNPRYIGGSSNVNVDNNFSYKKWSYELLTYYDFNYSHWQNGFVTAHYTWSLNWHSLGIGFFQILTKIVQNVPIKKRYYLLTEGILYNGNVDIG